MIFRAAAAVMLTVIATCSHAATTPVEGRKFFDRYMQLNDAFDPEVANLYTDASKIKALRRYPGGTDRVIEIAGAQWRSMLVSSMPAAKSKGDFSRFTNIRVEREGDKVRVTADRYSTLKCYTDKNYYMLVARDPTGRLYVAEEYFENQPQSDC